MILLCLFLRLPNQFVLQTALMARKQKQGMIIKLKKMKRILTKNNHSGNYNQLQIQLDQVYPQLQLGIGLDNRPRIQIFIQIKR